MAAVSVLSCFHYSLRFSFLICNVLFLINDVSAVVFCVLVLIIPNFASAGFKFVVNSLDCTLEIADVCCKSGS